MDIGKSLVETVSKVLKNQPTQTMHLSSIANHVKNLKPRQKKYIKVSKLKKRLDGLAYLVLLK